MSQTTPPSAALRKLAVLQTLSEAYGRVPTNLPLLARAALVPFLLSLALVLFCTRTAKTVRTGLLRQQNPTALGASNSSSSFGVF